MPSGRGKQSDPATRAVRKRQLLERFEQAEDQWGAAMRAHRVAPPDLGFASRLRALGEAAAAEAAVGRDAAQLGLATPIPPPRPAMSPATAAGAGDPRTPDVHALADLEKQMIVAALREAGGNKSRAAAALGLSRTRFYTRLRHLGLAD